MKMDANRDEWRTIARCRYTKTKERSWFAALIILGLAWFVTFLSGAILLDIGPEYYHLDNPTSSIRLNGDHISIMTDIGYHEIEPDTTPGIRNAGWSLIVASFTLLAVFLITAGISIHIKEKEIKKLENEIWSDIPNEQT